MISKQIASACFAAEVSTLNHPSIAGLARLVDHLALGTAAHTSLGEHIGVCGTQTEIYQQENYKHCSDYVQACYETPKVLEWWNQRDCVTKFFFALNEVKFAPKLDTLGPEAKKFFFQLQNQLLLPKVRVTWFGDEIWVE